MSLTRTIGFSLLLVAVPLLAAGRQHAITAVPTVTISGVVRDATGKAVAGAVVSSGTSTSFKNGTGPDGKYSLTLPANRPTVITVDDFAYESGSFPYTPVANVVQDYVLTSRRPAVMVKLTSGETHELDLGTSQFGYYYAFVGYTRTNYANYCRLDGSVFRPTKTEFARIIGPGEFANFSTCTRGPALTFHVEMKSGETTAVYLNDSCYGFDVFFIGREPATGQFLYLDFRDIAEIDFP